MLMGRRVYPTTLVSPVSWWNPSWKASSSHGKTSAEPTPPFRNSLLHRWQNHFRLGNQPKSAWAKAGRNRKRTGNEDATLSGPSNVQCVFLGTFPFAVFIHCHQSYNDTSLYPGCFQDAHQIHLMIFVHMFFLLIHTHTQKKKVKLSHLTSATPPVAKRSSVPEERGFVDVQQQNDAIGMAFHDFMTLAPGNPWKTPIKMWPKRKTHTKQKM